MLRTLRIRIARQLKRRGLLGLAIRLAPIAGGLAALANPIVLASGGGGGEPRWAVLSFQKVTAADTFDASTLTGIAAFTSVTSALFVATSNRTATTTLATIVGTVVTIVGAGIAADSGFLFIVGE